MKRFAKKALAGALTLSMVVGTVAIVDAEPAEAKKVTVKKVTVTAPSGKTAYVAKGKKVKLSTTVKVTPNKSANKKVTYKSANKSVASVSSKGEVKGVKPGTTKITVISSKNKKKKATIKVVVKKAAIKKVTISAKKLALNLGDKKKLTAKATPSKNTSTKIAWSSSKKSVATVSSAGVVTAKKVGTATITAKAADGSGKKATCKVTVKNSINIASMDVLNAQSVSFALDRATPLNATQIFIKTKANVNGTYNNELKIDSVTTTDNIHYNVVVNSETRIYENQYVQLSIPSLPGSVKTMEKQYTEPLTAYTNEEISTWRVGRYDKEEFWFSQSNGYSAYQISGLPAGLTSEVKGGSLYVKGTPQAAGTVAATMTAKDELGNTLTKTIYFVVGSDTALAGACRQVYTFVSTTDSSNVSVTPTVAGGSGDYKYSIVADLNGSGARVDEEEGYVSANIKIAGDYNVIVRATDASNPALSTDVTVTIHVSQGVTVAGMVKDAAGNAIPYARIQFTNKNKADMFCTYSYATTDDKGSFAATISAGTYDVMASYHDDSEYSDNAKAVNFLYKQDMNASKSGFDITLPLYKVALVANEPNVSLSGVEWYSNHEYMGYGSAIYVKSGTYALESEEIYGDTTTTNETTVGDWFNGKTVTVTSTSNKYKWKGTATVANAPVQVAVTKETVATGDVRTYTSRYPAAKDTTYTAYANIEYDLEDTGFYDDDDNYRRYFAYKFTPSETGNYTIDNSSVRFYDTTGTPLPTTIDGYYPLTAGSTYYVGAGDYDKYASFKIEKQADTSEE